MAENLDKKENVKFESFTAAILDAILNSENKLRVTGPVDRLCFFTNVCISCYIISQHGGHFESDVLRDFDLNRSMVIFMYIHSQ